VNHGVLSLQRKKRGKNRAWKGMEGRRELQALAARNDLQRSSRCHNQHAFLALVNWEADDFLTIHAQARESGHALGHETTG
jgi:hypothetical protein